MNRKTIFGITALLAVIALGLAFTACPKDEDERSVTFINDTSSSVNITFQNYSGGIQLEASTQGTPPGQGPSKTATKKGEDLILNTIVFTKYPLSEDEEAGKYVTITGAVVGGKQSKDVKGLALAYGTIIFSPTRGIDANPAGFKISTIPQDE